MEKLIDMHTHSNYSDGELSPMELIEFAIKNNVSVLSITDHDTIAGIKSVDKNDPIIVNNGIRVINGIELSAKADKGRMHILGYGIDLDNERLNQKMEELRDNSVNSLLSVMEQIKRDYNIVFKYKDIKKLINANHNLGRPDLAKLCIKYGYASSVDDAFKRYLIEAKNKVRGKNKGLLYKECIKLITDAGGIPVLAHPKSLELGKEDFINLLENMIAEGLMGIEVYHSTHTKEEMEYYLNVAEYYGLYVSGGSDYHGVTVKPDINIGTGKNNNIHIKELSLVKKLDTM